MSDTLVLCYHALSDSWPADLSVTPEAFERQLSLLVDRDYRGVTFSEAVRTPGDGNRVAITFDDAYRSVHDLALPVMAKLGLVGTVFVVTGFLDSDQPMGWPGVEQWLSGPHRDELLSMSRPQLQGLLDAGWEIGSHTQSHPRLSQLDDGAIRSELEQSRLACEQLTGTSCSSLAYPYGDFDQRVVVAAEAAGYRAAGCLSARFKRGRPLEWPRVGVYNSDSLGRFRVKVSPAVRWLRSTAAWDVADAARSLLRRDGR